ncbi:uncharacterized protein BJ212DRAFT_995629 [Suillus subaureus]|uniref:Uncharacterized protein n=1 Tax=Suillus subaureus TaxID=48587 RepID=A0A9P7DU87_9AGAM|nr:uncharacterized protein BJ212DRAFT_995629 [Suillus subaureus]KAG1803042.1 hypothetical protein BJ212DRAFT_995629 [Suillus subaureus]
MSCTSTYLSTVAETKCPLYIATNSLNPVADPSFSIYLQTFPCIFFLSDSTSRLTPLDELINPYDQVPLKEFLILVLDTMVLLRLLSRMEALLGIYEGRAVKAVLGI